MKKKVLGVIVCMLMVGTIFSASGNIVVKNVSNQDDDFDIYNNDVEWITQLVDSEGDVGLYSDLIADDINQFLSYYDNTNGDLKYAVWDGESWDIQVVDSVGDVGMHSSLAFGMMGNPLISYYDKTNGNLKYAYWNPYEGGYWVTQTVDSTGDVGQGSSLSISVAWNGDTYYIIPHISYYDATNNKLKYAFKSYDPPEWYIYTIDDGGLYNDMIVDSEGFNKAIAYTGADGGLKYCYYYCNPDGGCYWVDEVVDNSGEGWDISIACDDYNRPHISYYKNGKLYYTWKSGTSFTTPVVVDNVIYGGWGSSIATYDNDAYISYYKYDTRDLYYRKMSESSGVPLLTEGDVGQHSSIFVYDGLVHVSSYDNTNDDMVKVFQQVEEEEDCLVMSAEFQPVQVCYQDDPLYPPSDLDVSNPCVLKAGLDMVAGKNTVLFGHPYSDRKTINITVCNHIKEFKANFVFSRGIKNEYEDVIHETEEFTIKLGTHKYPLSAPIPDKSFQWKIWEGNTKSKEGYIKLKMKPDNTKACDSDICDPHKCTEILCEVRVNKTIDLTIYYLPHQFSGGPPMPDFFKEQVSINIPFDRWNNHELWPWWESIYPVAESGPRENNERHGLYPLRNPRFRWTFDINFDNRLGEWFHITSETIFKTLPNEENKSGARQFLYQAMEYYGPINYYYMHYHLKRIIVLVNTSLLTINPRMKAVGYAPDEHQYSVCVIVDWNARTGAAAHEIGHSYGLKDNYVLDKTDPDHPRFIDEGDHATGYWVNNNSDVPQESFDIMASSHEMWSKTEKTWISKPNYKRLLHEFTNAKDPEILGIGGWINKNDEITLDPWYHLDEGYVDIEWGSTGDYLIKAYNQNGVKLGQAGFDIEFSYNHDDWGKIPLEKVPFYFNVEYLQGLYQIDIVNASNNQVLASKTKSSNLPTVDITSPRPGEKIKPTKTEISWTANDADYDDLLYHVYLKYDEDEVWCPLNLSVTDMSCIFDLSDCPKGNYELMVFVTDGWNIAEDIVDFTIKDGKPKFLQLFRFLENYPTIYKILQLIQKI